MPAEPEEPDGAEVVRKTASLPNERQRLLREAEVLRAAAARGVSGLPEVLVAPSADGSDPCLVTAAVAGPSLAVAAPLPVLEVAGVVAEAARLLAGLHEVGLVHGSVGPSHVVLDGAGGAILVGLGDGGPVGAPSPDAGAGPLDPAADVADWGALVGHLLDWSAAGDAEPLVALRRSLAERRPRRGRTRQAARAGDEHERRVLAALADQAQDPDPARRPSARSLAAAIGHRIPDARVPGAVATAPTVQANGLLERLAAHVVITGAAPAPNATRPSDTEAPDSDPPSGARQRRRSRLGARGPAGTPTAAPTPTPPWPAHAVPMADDQRSARRSPARRQRGLASGADGAPHGPLLRPGVAARQRSTPAEGAPPLPIATRRPAASRRWFALAATGSVLAVVATLAAARPTGSPHAGPSAACAPVAAPAADVDGDGCEEAVSWSEGILQAGPARFALGGPGDAWAIGDWDCDGRRTPALLHQGALAVFDTWPGPGAELQGRLVGGAAGATGLTVVPGPDGCDRPSPVGAGTGASPVEAGTVP